MEILLVRVVAESFCEQVGELWESRDQSFFSCWFGPRTTIDRETTNESSDFYGRKRSWIWAHPEIRDKTPFWDSKTHLHEIGSIRRKSIDVVTASSTQSRRCSFLIESEQQLTDPNWPITCLRWLRKTVDLIGQEYGVQSIKHALSVPKTLISSNR